MPDMEQLLREHGLPLFSLESTTPLAAFDVLGFTLQYDLCYSNVLTMLDLGGHSAAGGCGRTMEHPLVIAGGPCAANPEPMSRFIDLFVLGDGEEALPEVCDWWAEIKRPFTKPPPPDAPGTTDDRGFAAGTPSTAGIAVLGGARSTIAALWGARSTIAALWRTATGRRCWPRWPRGCPSPIARSSTGQ